MNPIDLDAIHLVEREKGISFESVMTALEQALAAAYKRSPIAAGDDARVEISLVKFVAARVLNEVIDRAIQVHGGLGLTDRTPLAAMWAMARGARIYDGADEVHKMVVARRILRSFEDGGTWRFT